MLSQLQGPSYGAFSTQMSSTWHIVGVQRNQCTLEGVHTSRSRHNTSLDAQNTSLTQDGHYDLMTYANRKFGG